ncbi:MAG: hypothetical protein ACRELA_22045 [Candidatus Rokuibacteriota bacterium]
MGGNGLTDKEQFNVCCEINGPKDKNDVDAFVKALLECVARYGGKVVKRTRISQGGMVPKAPGKSGKSH